MNRAVVFALTLSACTVDEPVDDLATTEQDIQQGSVVPDGHVLLNTTVFFRNEITHKSCSGTIIGPRHVITASHCLPRTGSISNYFIRFYEDEPRYPTDDHQIVEVWERFGVDDVNEDYSDTDGNWADYAVLTLANDIPSYARPATLPWWKQAEQSSVLAVGVGDHDGIDNGSGVREMRYRFNTVRYYQEKTLNTEDHISDGGDSGGPLYTNWSSAPVVHGVLYGYYYDYGGAGYRDRYTSTYYHAWKILEAMGHTTYANQDRLGNDYNTINSTQLECATKCMQSSTCKAYSYTASSSTCRFKNAQSGTFVSQPGTTYAKKVLGTPCTPGASGVCRM